MPDTAPDCGFDISNFHFRFRTGGFLLRDGKVLFVKTNFGDYCYVIGGGVKLGESTEECIVREFYEETGVKAKTERLAVVCENFFKGHGGNLEGMDCHTIEFYFILSTDEDVSKIPEKTDEGEDLVWIPIEEISGRNIKPNFVKERFDEILRSSAPLHIIEDSDRNN